MKVIDDLRETLGKKATRFKTGLLLEERVCREALDSHVLSLQACVIDYHELVSSRLSGDSRVVPLDVQDILADLRAVANSEGAYSVGLILNLDLALSKFNPVEIAMFWDGFSQLQPFAPTAVVVAIPTAATSVQPSSQALNSWKSWGRIALNVLSTTNVDMEKI
jgi:hypothetical protein